MKPRGFDPYSMHNSMVIIVRQRDAIGDLESTSRVLREDVFPFYWNLAVDACWAEGMGEWAFASRSEMVRARLAWSRHRPRQR